MNNENEKAQESPGREASDHERLVITRQDAINIFFRAIDHDDPFWENLLDDWYDEESDSFPSQWDVGKALGFTNSEMETATGVRQGRLSELGL